MHWVFIRVFLVLGIFVIVDHLSFGNLKYFWCLIDPSTNALSHVFVNAGTLLKLHVVYFAYLHKDTWTTLVPVQLNELNSFGITNFTNSILIILCTERNNPNETASVLSKASSMASKIIRGAMIETYSVNRYEYDGVHAVWDSANSINSSKAYRHIFLYFHSKGGFYKRDPLPSGERTTQNQVLTNTVIHNWVYVMRKFEEYPKLDLVAGFISKAHHPWFNFWYARATLLRLFPEPLVTSDRYYYEGWLGLHHISKQYGNQYFYNVSCTENSLCLALCKEPKFNFFSHPAFEPVFCEINLSWNTTTFSSPHG